MVQSNSTPTLEELFLSIDTSQRNIFPHDHNYVKRYDYMQTQLNQWVHPFVVAAAITVDGGFLNDHGPEHIKKVILRATQLLRQSNAHLTPYEQYLLLMAIQIHDIGNILGRNKHEINSLEIISKYGINAGQDRIEWDCVFEIAESHGGEPKDKISELTDENILDFPVRKKLLAAILKLADELAEDRSRTNRYMLVNGQIPEEAVIFHTYSHCLHSTEIDPSGKQIKLYFDIEEDSLTTKYKKKVRSVKGDLIDSETYLLNEIYSRTFKTHIERMYCMRFMRDIVNYEKIRVVIQITFKEKDARNKHLKKKIMYDLGEVGYPDMKHNTIFTICPQLEDYTAEKVLEMLKEKSMRDVAATY